MSVLDPLSHALAAALAGAHSLTTALGLDPDAGPGWVLSLVAVVVVVRLCVLPLSWHGVRLAHANARARPQLQELTRRYQGKRDQESLREMMAQRRAISAEHGVSRWGCLPLLVQVPVWFALYHLLSRAAAGTPFGLLDAGLVDSFRNATIAGVPLADSGYLGAGPVHLAVVAGLAGAAAVVSYVTQRVFVRQNTPPFAPPAPTGEQDGPPDKQTEIAEAMARTQTLLPTLSAGGMLLAGGVVPVALLVYWVASQLWTLGWTAAVWRFWPTPGTPAAERWAGPEPGGAASSVSPR